MSDKRIVSPDSEFIQEVSEQEVDSFKKCIQCGTCSVVCNLNQDENPFPRREMRQAQWGDKDALMKDGNAWLCYACNDCGEHCPRGARPGDTLNAIRAQQIKHYANPPILGKLLYDHEYLPVVFGIPMIILFIMLTLNGTFNIPEGEVMFAKFFPHYIIEPLFGLLFLGMIAASFLSGRIFWRSIEFRGLQTPEKVDRDNWIKYGKSLLQDLFFHQSFEDCNENKNRYLGHLGMFYGFLGLFFVTGVVAILAKLGQYPLTLWHPLKVMGNLSGILLLAGCISIIFTRMNYIASKSKTSNYDWLLIITMISTAATGFFTEFFRFADLPKLAYPIYFIHLVFVFVLIIYLPFSKFAHIFYRFLALLKWKISNGK